MTKRDRLLATLNFETVDRIPLLGGFVVSANHYVELAGVSEDVFFSDPEHHAIDAYRTLDPDGLILLRLPPGREGHLQYRGMTTDDFTAHARLYHTPEDVVAHVDALPSPGEALSRFDAPAWKDDLVSDLTRQQQALGDMVWIPTQWDVIHPSFEWYNVFGYENYMAFLGLYPEAADRLFASGADVQRAKAKIVAEVYRELDVVPLIHVGTDICGKNGPVVSPDFLRRHYLPHVRRALEPVVEAGFRTVWHSDGAIMPILDDLLDCGISGFQGFQWEYGVKLEEIVKKRTKNGEKLTIFAGPSTSHTLPFGSIKDVREEIEYIMDVGRDACALFMLPANDVLSDTPLENLLETYRYAAEYGSTGT
jgi:hypothetical protein